MGQIVNIVKNIVQGLWQGIQSLAGWIWDKVSGWISGIWDGICSFFGINSPSKEMAWVGEMLVEGLAGSIEDNGGQAVKAAEGMSKDINGVMQHLAKGYDHGATYRFLPEGKRGKRHDLRGFRRRWEERLRPAAEHRHLQ